MYLWELKFWFGNHLLPMLILAIVGVCLSIIFAAKNYYTQKG